MMKAKTNKEDYNKWFEKNLSTEDEKILKRAEYLWSEYQYRHDFVWNLIFRLTTAVVALAIIPYIQTEVTKTLKLWILAPPFLGITLAFYGWRRIKSELSLLDHIRSLYQPAQDHLFIRFHEDRESKFNKDIKRYIYILIVLAVVNALLIAILWIPHQLG